MGRAGADDSVDFAVSPTGIYKTGVDAVLEPYQGTVECTVHDALTDLPVPNVTVTVFHYDTVTVGDTPFQENQVTTDANGQFTYAADPTLAANSWYTLLFDADGYAKVWLGGVPYKAGADETAQSAAAGVTHFQVASNTTVAGHHGSPGIDESFQADRLCRPSDARHEAHLRGNADAPRRRPQGPAKLRLWHRETKKVSGQKVSYWHLRKHADDEGERDGQVHRLGQARLRGQVGDAGDLRRARRGARAATSAMKTFTVR